MAGIVGGLGAIIFWPKKELPKPNIKLEGAERYYDLCLQLRNYKGISKDGMRLFLKILIYKLMKRLLLVPQEN